MANKYCNLDGAKKIKDEYQKINIGFDKVEEDVNKINDDINTLDERVDTIITTPVEGVSAEEIIDARGGRPVLGKRFEDIETDIEDLEVELDEHKAESAIYVESFSGTVTEKIQAAINAAEGKILKFGDNKTYIIDDSITGVSNIHMIGNNTIIKSTNERIATGYFVFTNKSNIIIEGINFDQNQANLVTYQVSDYPNAYNVPLTFNSCSDVTIKNCKFTNLYNRSISGRNCTGNFTIRNNYFSSLAQNQTQIANHITFTTFHGHLIIDGNFINNSAYSNADYGICGVSLEGVKGSFIVSNNRFNYCGRNNTGGHRLGVIDLYGNCNNGVIANNISTNTCWHFLRINSCQDIKVINNIIDMSINPDMYIITLASTTTYWDVGNRGTKNILIEGNTITAHSNGAYGIGGASFDYAVPFKNIQIKSNQLYNIKQGISIEGCMEGVQISGNIIKGTDLTNVGIRIGESTQTELYGITQEQSFVKDIIINHNIIEGNLSNGISIAFSTYTGTVGDILINFNDINNLVTTGYGITSGKGLLKVIGNTIKGGNYSLYLRSHPILFLFNNTVASPATAALLESANETVIKDNNYNGVTLF